MKSAIEENEIFKIRGPLMFRALRFLQIAVLTTTAMSFAAAQAENNPLVDLAQKIQEDRMKAENATTESQTQITEIESQKAALDVKKREIEEANAKNMEAVKKELQPEALDQLMSLKIPNCKITKDIISADGRQEYLIENTDASGNKAFIRFFFNHKRTLLMPVARPFKSKDGTHFIEALQPRFSPKDESKDGYMSAKVIYNPETLEVLHAVFSGERRKDTAFFWDSNTPFMISCIIGD